MEENIEITAKQVRGVPFQKGDDPRRNTAGRPTGTESFITKWRRAIERIGSQNNMSPDEVEQQLLLVGYKKAKEGDYRFWSDIFDRSYGKALQSIDHTTDGKQLPTPIYIPRDDSTKEDIES